MSESKWKSAASACLKNGEQLLNDVDWLCTSDRPGSGFALAIIAQEEFAKGFLLYLVSENIVPWNSLLFRAARDHTCKQLLAIVMDHIHPDSDEFLRRMDEWRTHHEEAMSLLKSLESTALDDERDKIWARLNELNKAGESFPGAVADALNILRHEKIGKWESKNWSWDEEPNYHPCAKAIAEGGLDREKQDGLYVKLGRDGTLVTTPASVRPEAATEALERARRFEALLRQLLNDQTGGLLDFDRIKSAFTVIFESLNPEKS